ncbi:MAG: hypothetical protein IT378_10605 [Sandaracinaceae bacterium]|nr:hypothetical protein [Sandaracinaceae bacterium]
MSKKKSSTIENRVYLFDSLAASLLAGGVGDLLASADDKERERALRALADAAFVSCVVADTADLDAATVRDRIASPSEPDTGD